jgi:glycerol kinase
MRVDGGGSRNEFLLQFQADLSRHDVLRPRVMETTALGAAMLAGLEVDMWHSRDELDALWREDVRFTPVMDGEHRDACLRGWRRAVERAGSWAMTQDMEAADG